MERTEQEKKLVRDVVDDLNPVQFFADMQECFGTRRMVELVGYAVLWGVLGVEDVAAMRRRYEEAGLSRTGMFRAAADYKKLGDFLLKKHGRRVEMKELLRRMQGKVPNAVQPVV
jgi:hypothetical protein